MRLTIRAQIILACLVVIFPLAAVEVYFLGYHYGEQKREAVAEARRDAYAVAATVGALMVNLRNGAQVLAEEARLARGDPHRIQPIFERMVRATKTPAYIVFILPDGRVGASVPRDAAASGLNLADRPFFQALRAGGEWHPADLLQSRMRRMPVWGVAAAVRAADEFLGVVAITVPATEFAQIIPETISVGTWSIVDRQGMLVYRSGISEIPWTDHDWSKEELIRRALLGEEATSEGFVGPDGVLRLGASVPAPPFGWAVEVSRPVAEALVAARRESWLEAGKYVPVLLCAILIAVLIGNRVGPPLARLAAAADRVARGEYGSAGEPGGPPEIRRLIGAFNVMAASLSRRERWDEALKTIGRAATAHLPLGEVLSTGLEAMMHASGTALGIVRLLDAETKELVLAAHRNLPPEYLGIAARISWGENLAGAVAASGEPRLVGRLPDQPDISRLSLLGQRIHSLVCLPLEAESQVVGTLSLGHQQPDFFGPADLPFLLPVASMLAGAIIAEQLREAADREAEEKTLLFRELDHRVRNNLAALVGLLHMGAENAPPSAAESLQEMANRVERLADVHNLLSGRGRQSIEVKELAEVVARNVLTALPGVVQIRWSVAGAPVRIPPARVTALALILNELLTNCAEHAFPGRLTGTVSIRVLRDREQAGLDVRDDGVGFPIEKSQPGLGLTIVQTLVTQNLQGAVRFAREGGTLVSIRFPVPEETSAGGGV